MSAVLDEPEAPMDSVPEPQTQLPDATVLEDKTPEWFRSRPVTVLLTILLGCWFVVLAARPLWHSDLWDHVDYGDLLLQQKAMFHSEPLLPLAQGVPMVNIPWLTQVGMSALIDRFGLSSIQFVFSSCITLSLALVVWRASTRARSGIAGLIALAICLLVGHVQLIVVRPQVVAVILNSIVLVWAFSRHRFRRIAWVGLPLLFAFWANCHGSFAVGLITIGISVAGRATDVYLRSRSPRLAIRDPQFIRGLLLLQLCAAAVLINPFGLAVYPEVFTVAGNPNVETMYEWEPLTLRDEQGQYALMGLLL
ncbi:MAG: hypothetical protein KDA85_06630, partial [Planctomycetaceae bacterium]|nr:hypothetical protein [Planctomycetaceae bacterium]